MAFKRIKKGDGDASLMVSSLLIAHCPKILCSLAGPLYHSGLLKLRDAVAAASDYLDC